MKIKLLKEVSILKGSCDNEISIAKDTEIKDFELVNEYHPKYDNETYNIIIKFKTFGSFVFTLKLWETDFVWVDKKELYIIDILNGAIEEYIDGSSASIDDFNVVYTNNSRISIYYNEKNIASFSYLLVSEIYSKKHGKDICNEVLEHCMYEVKAYLHIKKIIRNTEFSFLDI
jgi:hypothetical protein